MFGNHTRVFGFAKQVLAAGQKKPVLFAPLVMNIALAVPVHAVLIILSLFLSDSLAMMLMPVGLSALYFIDYFSGGLNTAMVYEEQTTGNATLGSALKRTLKAAIGIAVFAVVSGLLDFAVQVLSDRRLHMLRPVLAIVRSFWSTATFIIMPAMIIEGLGFRAAFERSKELAKNDPTQIGVGYIGMGLATSLISLVGFVLVSFVGTRILMPISPLLGLAFSLVVINATWAVAAYLKSTYYTCFYMWSRECERNRGVNPALAPAPLRSVLADVDFAALGFQIAPVAAAMAVAVAGAPGQAGFGAPQGGFAAPQQQSGFAAPQQQGGFAPPQQQGGFAPPQQQGGFAPPQPQGGFVPQPQQGGFAAPQPQGFAPPQQGGFTAPAPQAFAAPQPQGGFTAPAPQPQGGFTAPAPQAFAPAPQPYPQPSYNSGPAPQPYPQPSYNSGPAPQAYPQPQPAFASAPAPQPYPAVQPQASAPAPRPYPAVQPSAPPPRPYPAVQASASAPAPRPYPQPQSAQASAPAPQPPSASVSQLYPSLDAPDSGELQGEATVVSESPFDDEATRVV